MRRGLGLGQFEWTRKRFFCSVFNVGGYEFMKIQADDFIFYFILFIYLLIYFYMQCV